MYVCMYVCLMVGKYVYLMVGMYVCLMVGIKELKSKKNTKSQRESKSRCIDRFN